MLLIYSKMPHGDGLCFVPYRVYPLHEPRSLIPSCIGLLSAPLPVDHGIHIT